MFEVGYFLGMFSPVMLILEKTSRNPNTNHQEHPHTDYR